jgi:hypothetical protein
MEVKFAVSLVGEDSAEDRIHQLYGVRSAFHAAERR